MRALLLSAVLALSACGQTGNLYLPDDAPAKAGKPAPAADTPHAKKNESKN